MITRWLMGGLAALVLLQPEVRSQDDPLERARWLTGCWELRRGDRTILEMWMPPAGGLMMGNNRTTVGDVLRDWEHLRLSVEAGRLVYTAIPMGQRETAFASVALSDSGFTVENLAHDFPQRVIYRRLGSDSLVSRIEGPGPSGPRGVDFPMRRVPCAGP